MNRFAEFERRLGSYSSRRCIEGSGFSYAYYHVADEMHVWQDEWEKLGLTPGSVIGLRADYSVPAIAALFALCAQGMITALIPKGEHLEHYLADANAELLMDVPSHGRCEYRQVAPRQVSHPLLERLRAIGDAGLIIFTSGTSGRPKAALHSVDRFLLKFQRAGRSLRTLAFLLFDHIAGLDTLFYTLSNGGTLVIPLRRDPDTILDLIASQRVQVLPTSPSFLRLLSAVDQHRNRDLSSLEVITYGSEPMDAATLTRLNKRFPGVEILQKYGTTEIGSPRTISRGSDSLWLKVKNDGTEARVVDGILWLRSESTMLGYLNAPSPVDENGWYCTGDLVEVDGEWIRFLGREDDIIKVGGLKVAPAEVERVIRALDFVRDVLVSAEPHPLMGQIVAARIVLHDGELDNRTATARIRSHCRKHLAPHQVPVRIAIGSEQFLGTLGPRYKLQRR